MKTILHLCADIGSDSWFYQQNREYKVILIGKEIGINYTACCVSGAVKLRNS